MTVEFIDLDDARAYVGFDAATDSATNMEVAHMAGNAAVLDFLGWDPTLKEVTETYQGYGGQSLPLGRREVRSVSAVVIEGVSIPITSFVISNRQLIYRTGRFPLGMAAISVTYRAGFNPLPDPILLATRIAVKAIWTAMGMDPNFAAHIVPGVESASFYQDGPGALPPTAKVLLRPHRIVFVP